MVCDDRSVLKYLAAEVRILRRELRKLQQHFGTGKEEEKAESIPASVWNLQATPFVPSFAPGVWGFEADAYDGEDMDADEPMDDEKCATHELVDDEKCTDKSVDYEKSTNTHVDDGKRAADEFVEDEKRADKPVDDEKCADKPADDEKCAGKPVEDEKCAADEFVEDEKRADKSVDDEKCADKPVNDEKSAEKPVDDEKCDVDKPVDDWAQRSPQQDSDEIREEKKKAVQANVATLQTQLQEIGIKVEAAPSQNDFDVLRTRLDGLPSLLHDALSAFGTMRAEDLVPLTSRIAAIEGRLEHSSIMAQSPPPHEPTVSAEDLDDIWDSIYELQTRLAHLTTTHSNW